MKKIVRWILHRQVVTLESPNTANFEHSPSPSIYIFLKSKIPWLSLRSNNIVKKESGNEPKNDAKSIVKKM